MAMLGSVMKQGAPSTVDANLGAISSEDAVVRLRALGLDKDDYSIETINGDRVATIRESGLDKLASAADPEELAVQRDVDDIKRGVYDEEGWLPAGLVARPVESYEDPGVDPDVPEGEIDNQSIADDAEGMQSAQEAAHRALGDMPEGKFAFKSVDDLSLQEETDLRRVLGVERLQGVDGRAVLGAAVSGREGRHQGGRVAVVPRLARWHGGRGL